MTIHPIPDAALESDIAILGKKGRGKSYTARGLVERLLDAGRQVVVLDPLSTWWGLKAGPNAYPIAVLGGPHADLPLDPGSGERLGRFVATSEQSLVLDLGEMRKAELIRFATPFLEELYTGNRKALWLVLEEADVFAPQQPIGNASFLLGEVDRIARRGRQYGFRLISLTQRPARLHKDVLTQLSTLIALGLTSPQDRDAIKAWVEGAGDRSKAKEVLDTLAALRVGEGWVWAPDLEILERVRFPKIKTPDTSATPKAGEPRKAAKVRKDVDVAALREALVVPAPAASESKGAAARRPSEAGAAPARPASEAALAAAEQRGYDRGLQDGEARGLERGARAGWRACATLFERDVTAAIRGFAAEPAGHEDGEAEVAKALGLAAWPSGKVAARPAKATAKYSEKYSPPSTTAIKRSVAQPNGHADLSAPRQRILDGLAWLAMVGVTAPEKTTLAHFVGASPSSGGYFNNLGALRGVGLIEYPAGGTVALTSEGAAAAVAPENPPTHEAVMTLVAGKIPSPMMRVLEAAVERYPDPVGKDALAGTIGVSATSGGYFNNLGRLRSMGLLTYPAKGEVRAADILFPEQRG